MENLITATGKEFEVNYLATIPYPEQAYIRIAAPIATVAEVFSDPEETVDLYCGENHLHGYTALVAIIPEADVVRICLRKEN